MDNRYNKGKIYKIVSNYTDDIYIGSTIQTLSKRMGGHRSRLKKYLTNKHTHTMACDICKFQDAKIYLIEEYKCESKIELEKRERYFIETMENVINRYIPTRTQKERYDKNINGIKETLKLYADNHKAEKKAYDAKRRITHKKILSDKRKNNIATCNICNITMKAGSVIRHEKTKKHLECLGCAVDEFIEHYESI